MNIEIYSDVVCPWCYIGKRRFEKALAAHPGAQDVEVTWRPFQLDPEASTEPIPHLQAYAAKIGDQAKVDATVAELRAAADAEDLDLRLDLAQRVNTFDAHRLLGLALTDGGTELQHRVKERLMRAYFSEGRNVADHGELAALGKEAGLTGVDVSGHLASDAGVDDLKQQLGEGRALGLDSVPTFVFERRWAVSGAQSPQVMGQVLMQIEAAMLGGGGGCCGGGGGGCACSA
ncbi:MAG: DsbA family oxidoreductase [Geodermatophilaceae bacterium]